MIGGFQDLEFLKYILLKILMLTGLRIMILVITCINELIRVT